MNKKNHEISINSEYITLGQFLKFADIIHSGGEAKRFLSSNTVKINGVEDNRRGRKLKPSDVVEVLGEEYAIRCLSEK